MPEHKDVKNKGMKLLTQFIEEHPDVVAQSINTFADIFSKLPIEDQLWWFLKAAKWLIKV